MLGLLVHAGEARVVVLHSDGAKFDLFGVVVGVYSAEPEACVATLGASHALGRVDSVCLEDLDVGVAEVLDILERFEVRNSLLAVVDLEETGDAPEDPDEKQDYTCDDEGNAPSFY